MTAFKPDIPNHTECKYSTYTNKKRDWNSELKYTIPLHAVYKADIHSMES